ncbi:MAG: hypothetical protein MUF71_15790 [Candidatus Kapabacteria bacterium]|nr:hypothetical protein [Candidatus Kapabacteria bacterium]
MSTNRNDRYSEDDRRLYNQHYYSTHREKLNRNRNKRRASCKIRPHSRRVILATQIPSEVLEILASWVCDGSDDEITISSVLSKSQVRRALSAQAREIVFRNVVVFDNTAQNSPKQNEGI